MATPYSLVTDARPAEVRSDREPRWAGRLFGTFQLLGRDGADATPTSRKARALVAYLLTCGEQGATRDRLAGLLWSERGDDQARASLRQTLYELRALSSGEAAPIAIDRTGVTVVAARITTDLERLDASARDGDAVAIAALLGERPFEFLADLDGIDPAFDEWLAAERVNRGNERRRVALAVGGGALCRDAAAAHRIAARLLTFDPTDEAAARLAMEASHRQGDRDAVRQTFRQLRESLRDDLGVQPAGETLALHDRLMTAEIPLRATTNLPTAVPANEESPPARRAAIRTPRTPRATAAPRRRPTLLRRALFAGAGLSFVLAIGGFALWWSTPAIATHTLAVEALRAGPTDSAANALRVGFSGDLARLIVGNDATLRVVDAPSTPTRASSDTFRVDGEASSDAGLVHATVRLARETGGPILWSHSFVRPVGEVDALREEMASKLGDVSICALGRTNPKAADFSAEAMRLMLAACEQIHLLNTDETTKLFEQLVALRPDYAHGWAMLAAGKQISALNRPGSGDALAADAEHDAQRALALDPHDGEAYYARALRLQEIAQWSARMEILERGHALDPANGQLDDAIGHAFEQIGRLNEAATFYQHAVDADPFGVYKAADRARLLGFTGNLGGEIAALAEGRRRFANHRAIAYADFQFSSLLGDPRRAQTMLDDPHRGFPLRPDRAALWAHLIADRIEPSPENDARASDAIREAMRSSAGNVTLILETLGRQNRVDEAYAFIDRLTPTVQEDLQPEVLFEVLTRSLRDDPRFMTVALRLGLVPIWERTDHWPDFCSEPGVPFDCRAEARRARSSDARPLIAAR